MIAYDLTPIAWNETLVHCSRELAGGFVRQMSKCVFKTLTCTGLLTSAGVSKSLTEMELCMNFVDATAVIGKTRCSLNPEGFSATQILCLRFSIRYEKVHSPVAAASFSERATSSVQLCLVLQRG